MLVFGWAGDASAQWSTKWLAVGRLHHPYLSGGAEPENLVSQLNWPGIKPGTANNHWKGLWISARNYKDEAGKTWQVRTSHIGPRILGIGEFFDRQHNLVARFEAPVVQVDGFDTFHRPTFVDDVQDNLGPDRMVHSIVNTSIGVTMEKKAMQWSHDLHDSYHLIEYVFTNTGNTDDDDEIEITGQTLEDVYFTFMDRPKINAESGSWDNSSGGMAWGQHVMNDATFAGHDEYGVDFRSQFAWLGNVPGKSGYTTLGNPMWFNHQWNSVPNDTLGRLGGASMIGTVVIHADREAHPADGTSPDDPAQPHTMTYLESDWSDITTGSDHNNEAKMITERDWMERGSELSTIADPTDSPRTIPTHAELSQPDRNFATQSTDPSLGKAGGWGYMNAYGPYDMAPGAQVKIVVAEGVAGLSEEAAWEIGRAHKLAGANRETVEFEYDADGDGAIEADERMTKNEWALTARDSLFQLFRRAINNYRTGMTQVPNPPLPPSRFEVTSGTNAITIEWEPYAGNEPPQGWQLYRAQNDFHGIVTSLRAGPNNIGVPDLNRQYTCIAGCAGTPALPGSARSFTDQSVQPRISYFYYLQAIGNTVADPTDPNGRAIQLKSSRYYAQTYEPALLRKPTGTDLSQVRVVPNPYSLSQTTDVRFGDKQDKMAFVNLPARATIKIYTELGELVNTIEHTDGSGDDFWDMTTSSRQLIVSGLYIAVIENTDDTSAAFGDKVIRKIIVVR